MTSLIQEMPSSVLCMHQHPSTGTRPHHSCVNDKAMDEKCCCNTTQVKTTLLSARKKVKRNGVFLGMSGNTQEAWSEHRQVSGNGWRQKRIEPKRNPLYHNTSLSVPNSKKTITFGDVNKKTLEKRNRKEKEKSERCSLCFFFNLDLKDVFLLLFLFSFLCACFCVVTDCFSRFARKQP